jgi:hypothetical protein
MAQDDDNVQPEVGTVPPQIDLEHNEPSEQQEKGGVINVPQTPAPIPGIVYSEPGEIGIPNVVPSGYDPTKQPGGEAHGVPQPAKTVEEAEGNDKS